MQRLECMTYIAHTLFGFMLTLLGDRWQNSIHTCSVVYKIIIFLLYMHGALMLLSFFVNSKNKYEKYCSVFDLSDDTTAAVLVGMFILFIVCKNSASHTNPESVEDCSIVSLLCLNHTNLSLHFFPGLAGYSITSTKKIKTQYDIDLHLVKDFTESDFKQSVSTCTSSCTFYSRVICTYIRTVLPYYKLRPANNHLIPVAIIIVFLADTDLHL